MESLFVYNVKYNGNFFHLKKGEAFRVELNLYYGRFELTVPYFTFPGVNLD